MKKCLGFIVIFMLFFVSIGNVSLADVESSLEGKNFDDIHYIYFWGQTCGHCAIVEKYREKSDIDEQWNIEKKEVQQNGDNAEDMLQWGNKFGITDKLGTPFLVVIQPDGSNGYIMGSEEIIQYTKDLENGLTGRIEYGESQNLEYSGNHLKFFAIMMPAALSDSINPCAFAVMLLLLTTILSKTDNKKKALLSGLLFALAVFVTYFLMGIGIFKILGNMQNLYILKWIVGIVGILVGLANIKDYFRYGKMFNMEIPKARRPTMIKIVKQVTSPIGAFVIGIIVSLFLLPCSSGPYLTILGFLSSENQGLTTRGYIYLIVYNLIFVLPMVAIALLVGLGFTTAEKLGTIKNRNTKLIHLIVGLLMIGLGIYVLSMA